MGVCLLSLVFALAHAAPAVDMPAAAVRFVAFGDGGSGGEDAYRVARAARAVCAQRGGCAFGVLLGDNVYPRGIADVHDAQWEDKIEKPYGILGVPLYAVLGNHDYGAPTELFFLGGIGLDPRRAEAALERGRRSAMVHMPDHVFARQQGPLQMVFIDTQPFALQRQPWVSAALDMDASAERIERKVVKLELQSRARWRIAFGHHPVKSNGKHGDAEGPLADFLRRRVAGHFDAYLSGHDHLLEDMGDERGTALMVSGGASAHRKLESTRAVPFAQSTLGFVVVEADAQHLLFTFIAVEDAEDGAAHTDDGSRAWRVAHQRRLGAP